MQATAHFRYSQHHTKVNLYSILRDLNGVLKMHACPREIFGKRIDRQNPLLKKVARTNHNQLSLSHMGYRFPKQLI